MDGQDVLDSDAFAEHEGGFAAAAALLGASPTLYHPDTSRAGVTQVRTLAEEIARVVRGRAANPRWIAGQMRHGHRGAARNRRDRRQPLRLGGRADIVREPTSSTCCSTRHAATSVSARFLMDCNPAAAGAIARRFDEALRRGLWTLAPQLGGADPAGHDGEARNRAAGARLVSAAARRATCARAGARARCARCCSGDGLLVRLRSPAAS